MPLTPAEVHNIAFKKPSLGKRGYDEEEVDAFLDMVEVELSRLIEENTDLRTQLGAGDGTAVAPSLTKPADGGDEQLAALQEQLAQTEEQLEETRQQLHQAQQSLAEVEQHPSVSQPGAPGSNMQPGAPSANTEGTLAPADHHLQAVQMLALAQQTADQHLAQSRAEADRLVSEAQAHAETTVADADARSTRQLADAEARAKQLDEESSSRATQTVQEAEQRAAAISAQFEQRKVSLERRVEELRNFEREYRSRLKNYLQSQLRDLDASAKAEPDGRPTELADAKQG